MSKTKDLMTENTWILLSLFLTNQADDDQTTQVLEWRAASPENQTAFEQIQRVMCQRSIMPTFSSEEAFKKLDKKIARL
jgi:ferric-dicitrate binding protein FerR (iron transport regulator)